MSTAIEGLLAHIRKQFGEKGDTDAVILRWADLAADEYLALSDSRSDLLAALKAVMNTDRVRKGLTAKQFAQVWAEQLSAIAKAENRATIQSAGKP